MSCGTKFHCLKIKAHVSLVPRNEIDNRPSCDSVPGLHWDVDMIGTSADVEAQNSSRRRVMRMDYSLAVEVTPASRSRGRPPPRRCFKGRRALHSPYTHPHPLFTLLCIITSLTTHSTIRNSENRQQAAVQPRWSNLTPLQRWW